MPLGYGHYAIYQNNATYFTHPNALGSTTMVTDYNGNVVQDKIFYPWGQDWQSIGTVYDERFATLQRRDTETSFDPTPNRMFASVEGRWLTPDPHPADVTNPQTWNRYAYVIGNPTTLADPTGLHFFSPCYPRLGGGGCTWSGDPNLGGGGGCTVDGITGPCSTAINANVACPGGICAGWATNSAGQVAYFQLTADANGNLSLNQLTGWANPSAVVQDPGCGPGVADAVNQSLADYQATFAETSTTGTETGGNWNYSFQSGPLGQSVASDIASEIAGPNGWGAGERFGNIPSLHIEIAGPPSYNLQLGGYVVTFSAHIDTINPDAPLVGPAGHFLIDIVGGNLAQFFGGSLACH